MFLDASNHIADRFNAVAVENEPYPHIQIDNIFPQQLYQQMLANEIPDEFLKSLYDLNRSVLIDRITGKKITDPARLAAGKESQRTLLSMSSNMPQLPDPCRLFWEQAAEWLLGPVNQIIMDKFKPYILGRFNGVIPPMESEVLYTRDTASYALGPHTDKVSKVIALLFYLPKGNSLSHLGTSVYAPTTKPNFTCEGGPHYEFKNFKLLKTAEYKPNTMFAFVKTKNSFHGVENIAEDIRRNLLIYDIQTTKS